MIPRKTVSAIANVQNLQRQNRHARTLKMVWGAAKQSFDLLPKVEGNDPKVKAVSILR